VSVLDQDFSNVSAGNENYRVAVFSHLLVPLAGNCRGGDQDANYTAFNFERASSAKLVINVCGTGREQQEFCSET
jgi:hypothetical protein